MRKGSKIAVATAGLVLAGGATAAAVTAPPEAADDGLTKAGENAGFEVPASNEDHPTPEDHPGGGGETDAVETADAPEGTHGAEVSAVAHEDFASGREHGEAVSEVARGDHGPAAAGAPVDTPNDGGIDTATEASDGANETGDGQASEHAGLGSENAGDHGQP